MSRVPTPKEIRDTNKTMVYKCDRCYKDIAGLETGGGELALHLTISGGYQEFWDTYFKGEQDLTLCHKCGHKFFKSMFPTWDTTNMHPKETEDKFCDGWVYEYQTDEEIAKELRIHEKLQKEGLA